MDLSELNLISNRNDQISCWTI